MKRYSDSLARFITPRLPVCRNAKLSKKKKTRDKTKEDEHRAFGLCVWHPKEGRTEPRLAGGEDKWTFQIHFEREDSEEIPFGHCIKNVIGEVYEVDEKMLSHLDILEDHPSFYIREIDQVQINSENEEKVVDCWIYFLKNFKPSLLEEECFTEYHSEGGHSKPYTPRQQRIPGYHAKTDVLIS